MENAEMKNRAYVLTEFRKDVEIAKRQKGFVGITRFDRLGRELEYDVAVMKYAVRVFGAEKTKDGEGWYVWIRPAFESVGTFERGTATLYNDIEGRPWWQHTSLTEYDYNKSFAENVAWEEV